MRILAVQPYADGAGHYGKYTARLCQSIAALDHDVVLCANVDNAQVYLDQKALFTIRPVAPVRPFVGFERSGVSKARWLIARIQNNSIVLRYACKLAQEEEFDVIQLFSYELVSSWLLLSLLYTSKLPPIVIEIGAPMYSSTVSTHEVAFESIWRRLQRYALMRLLEYTIRAIVVNSASHVETLRSQLKLPSDFPIVVVGDTREPGEVMEKKEARRRIGLDGYFGTIFLFFGTIRPDKNILSIVQAVRSLEQDEFRVVICGMPLGVSLPASFAGDRRIITRLAYIPEDEIDAYFFASDALLLPYKSSYTGSSGPVYEACARGLPVIATNVSEMGQIVAMRDLGLVVAPDNSMALSHAMKEFLHASVDQKVRWGANGRQMIAENGRTVIANRFIQLYQRLVRYS